MAVASIADVQGRLFGRTLTEGETATVQEWLDDVEADILTRYPDILSAGSTRLRQLVRVECEVVIWAMNTPAGPVRQESSGIDDYNDAKTYASVPLSSDRLGLSEDQWARLASDAYVSSGAFTISPTYEWPRP